MHTIGIDPYAGRFALLGSVPVCNPWKQEEKKHAGGSRGAFFCLLRACDLSLEVTTHSLRSQSLRRNAVGPRSLNNSVYSPFSRRKRTMERRSLYDPDLYLFLSTVWSHSVSSCRQLVQAVRCCVKIQSFGFFSGLWEVSRSGLLVFCWSLVVR